ncbi:FAD binding domain-containing protein [Chloroflexota bacterium]
MSRYLSPRTMEEAVSLLLEHKGAARVMAGGTDLLVQLKRGVSPPGYIIDMKGIPEQDTITLDERHGLVIGGLTTIRSIELSPVIKSRFSCLAQSASQLGTLQVRNRATIGGNICNAAPSAETASSLLVLEAKLKLISADGERVVPIESFFLNPGETVLRPHEILTEIRIPNLPPRSGSAYIAGTIRKALDLAIVGVAVATTIDKGVLTEVRIALGSVAPTPIRARKAEALIQGHQLDDERLHEVGLSAAQEASPIDDIRGSAEYRRKMIAVLVEKALRQSVLQTQAG